MNENHMKQISKNYIEKFEYLNEKTTHDENYKWFVAKEFRTRMDEALSRNGTDFAEALYNAKVCTYNMIDSYTQPFYGLVAFARHEPETVRQMFLDLYMDDGGDIHATEKRIAEFYAKSTALLEKYYPDSFLYKQDFHAISGYLFLYDPEHHYLFKSVQSGIFADCIEFYDDWGSGIDIRLDVYYRMCDWAVDQIKRSPELLATNQSRYELPNIEEMAPDVNKHILLFDLIYCCSVYDLFDGITFNRPKLKEKHLMVEKIKKATVLRDKYNEAVEMQHKYDEAIFRIKKYLIPGAVIYHKNNGKGIVQSCSENCTIEVLFGNAVIKTFSAQTLFAKSLVKTEDGLLENQIANSLQYLEKKIDIARRIKYAVNEVEPYKEYLDML